MAVFGALCGLLLLVMLAAVAATTGVAIKHNGGHVTFGEQQDATVGRSGPNELTTPGDFRVGSSLFVGGRKLLSQALEDPCAACVANDLPESWNVQGAQWKTADSCAFSNCPELDQRGFNFALRPGNYTLAFGFATGDGAIVALALDGIKVGTCDTYSAVAQTGFVCEFPVSINGSVHELHIWPESKNVASKSFAIAGDNVALQPPLRFTPSATVWSCPWNYARVAAGGAIAQGSSSFYLQAYYYQQGSTIGDKLVFGGRVRSRSAARFMLPPGQYTLTLTYGSADFCGKVQLSLDGVDVGAVIDGNDASTTVFEKKAIFVVAVSGAGPHEIVSTLVGTTSKSFYGKALSLVPV